MDYPGEEDFLEPDDYDLYEKQFEDEFEMVERNFEDKNKSMIFIFIFKATRLYELQDLLYNAVI